MGISYILSLEVGSLECDLNSFEVKAKPLYLPLAFPAKHKIEWFAFSPSITFELIVFCQPFMECSIDGGPNWHPICS